MGIEVVPEAATDLITQMQERGQPEPWTDHLFTERIVALQRQRQLAADAAATGVTAYDRSPVCTLALARYLGHPIGPLLREELDRMKQGYTLVDVPPVPLAARVTLVMSMISDRGQ